MLKKAVLGCQACASIPSNALGVLEAKLCNAVCKKAEVNTNAFL